MKNPWACTSLFNHTNLQRPSSVINANSIFGLSTVAYFPRQIRFCSEDVLLIVGAPLVGTHDREEGKREKGEEGNNAGWRIRARRLRCMHFARLQDLLFPTFLPLAGGCLLAVSRARLFAPRDPTRPNEDCTI